ncbi:hypothetical protein V6R21_19265 [Limibacter armeniacum]|uniref:phasin family protein n=1 Tax=Limibacter armeniacum TaxID=466084 RepID=UPI002FE6A8C6
MEELIKRFVYTGVGIVAFTAEKVKEIVDKLVAEEKLTEEEGKKIVDEFLSNTESRKDEFESQLKVLAEKFSSVFSMKDAKTEDVEDLKARIEALEARQKTAKSSSAKTTATEGSKA